MRYTFDLGNLHRFDESSLSFDSPQTFDQGTSVTFDSAAVHWDWGYQSEITWDATWLTWDRGESVRSSQNVAFGYWASPYWNNFYWDKRYWAEIQVTVSLKPGKVGGDDVPRYYKHKHKGWNKKAWKKHRLIDDLIDQSLNDILYPKPKKQKRSKYVPDYDLILRQLREIDDAEAEMLLL